MKAARFVTFILRKRGQMISVQDRNLASRVATRKDVLSSHAEDAWDGRIFYIIRKDTVTVKC